MKWPSEQICKRIADLWARGNDKAAYSGEKENAFAALERLQSEHGLSDVMLAYIAESYNKPVNVFDVVLEMILSSKIVLSFEHAITVALWSLHSCAYHHFMHTPRLLVESYEPGCGKTALGMLVNALACNTFFTSSTSAAAIYYRLRQCQHSTLIVDEVENSALWGQDKLLLSVFDAGHRKGGRVTRVIGGEVVEFPAFAPLMLMAVWQRPFAPQLLSRSILLHMEKHPEGRDEVDPNDPRFMPARAAQAQWASEFQRPKDCELPRELVGRAGDNWRPLVEIGDTLGYPATVRAAAVATHQPATDPATLLVWDIYRIFEARKTDQYSDQIWRDELVAALCELPDAQWNEYGLDQGLPPRKLTARDLLTLLRTKGIHIHVVRKGDKTGRGFSRRTFERAWLNLFGVTPSQPRKIINLIRHTR
jgi:hypothetical protein